MLGVNQPPDLTEQLELVAQHVTTLHQKNCPQDALAGMKMVLPVLESCNRRLQDVVVNPNQQMEKGLKKLLIALTLISAKIENDKETQAKVGAFQTLFFNLLKPSRKPEKLFNPREWKWGQKVEKTYASKET